MIPDFMPEKLIISFEEYLDTVEKLSVEINNNFKPTVLVGIMRGAGVKAGGKTGMTSLVIGVLFLACIFFAPLATSLPKQIDGAALLFVSVLFVRNITDIEWNDIGESAPAILAMIAMPLTYSISNGIALAFVSYALIRLLTGKASSTSPAIWVIAILSVISFAVS